LVPGLANPTGVLVPLRRGPDGPPFAMWHARGLAPRRWLPTTAALQDSTTSAGVRAGGILYLTTRVWDLLVLRALGLPAALAFGCADSPAACHELDRYAWPGTDGKSPALALVGCTLCPPSPARPPGLGRVAERLALARRHLGIHLLGVGAWVPTADEWEGIRLALTFREPPVAAAAVHSSAQTLVDFEAIIPAPEPTESTYPDALHAYQAALAADAEGGPPGEHLRDVRAQYVEAVTRDLSDPVRAAALKTADPVLRLAGVDLATAADILHQLAPLVFDLDARGAGDVTVLDRYLAYSRLFGSRLATLNRLRRAAR
jgi:hypothetical protein